MYNIKNNAIIRGVYFLLKSILDYLLLKNRFGQCGENVVLTPPIKMVNKENIFLSDNTCIGSNSIISAVNASFFCKGHCAIAENFTVHTGNHARHIGSLVTDFSEKNKPQGYDHDVIVEEDVWIGCNVTLLAGVTIGRGATVAAGAVVAKSMPPYCVCGGVPAKFIKFYWTIDQILEHESRIYPQDERFTRTQLEELFDKWG